MADESLQLPRNQNLDYHIISLFQRLESMRKDSSFYRMGGRPKVKPSMQVEIRTLEFWRYIHFSISTYKSICFLSKRIRKINFPVLVFELHIRFSFKWKRRNVHIYP